MNSISSLLWISIVIPNFKSHMSARVYFMKRVKDYKDMSIMSPQVEQWRRTSLLCILQFSCFLSTTVCSQNINKQNVNIADETLMDYSFLSHPGLTRVRGVRFLRFKVSHMCFDLLNNLQTYGFVCLILIIWKVYVDKKIYQKQGKKIYLIRQIVIESHSFLENWQNR